MIAHLLWIRILRKYRRRFSTPLLKAKQKRRSLSQIISSSPLRNFLDPDSQSRLLARYPIRLSVRGVSPYRRSTPWWFCRSKTSPSSSTPLQSHAGDSYRQQIQKCPIEGFFVFVGDRGVEPLTSTTSKWRSTN